MANKIIPLIITILLLGCGTMPPEKFWDGSREDSLAILDTLKNWRQLFQTSYYMEKTLIPVKINYRKIPLSDTFSQDFFPVAFQREEIEAEHLDSLVFSKDTTCTVYLIDRYKGRLYVKCDSFTKLVRIDTIIKENDTIINYIYDNRFTPKDTTLIKDFRGTAWNAIFFDRDTLGIWSPKRVAGALKFYMPDEASAPLIVHLIDSVGTRVDTIWWRPSPGQYGVHWLYPLDSMRIYGVNDTIALSDSFRVHAYMDSIPFIWLDSTRYEYSTLHSSGKKSALFTFTTPGFHRLSFEIGSAEALYSPTKPYRGIIWGIPIMVK